MNIFFFAHVTGRQRFFFGVGVVALLLCFLGACFNPRQFFVSYLFAYQFWLGLSLGCLCVAMIHHLTGGRWGDVTRRFLEAGYMTLPLMAALFVPVLFGLHYLYPWAGKDASAHNEVIRHRAHYLNETAFILRTILYFVIWLALALPLRRWSLRQDQTEDLAPTRSARALSGPGVVVYALTVTFAWIDWVMSMETDWFSTMYPVIICAGQMLCAFSFAILALAHFKNEQPYANVVEPGHFHHLGNLLLTFVIFWTYVNFGQFLIIWSGDLPAEISWYLHRIAGGWKWIAAAIALFNFFLPFCLLLFRASKRNFRPLRILAALVFVSQIVNAWWTVEPALFPDGLHLHWMDVAAPVGIGGLWLANCAVYFKRAVPLTRNDPRISHSFAHAQ